MLTASLGTIGDYMTIMAIHEGMPPSNIVNERVHCFEMVRLRVELEPKLNNERSH